MTNERFLQLREELIQEITSSNISDENTLDGFMIKADRVDQLETKEAYYRLEGLITNAKKSKTLGAYIREKAHLRNMLTYRPALFGQGQISRDYWSRLLNDEMKASKEKLLRVAVLLKLNVEETEKLLDKAGYSLSDSVPRDVVVQFCIQRECYDFTVIEKLLADHEIQSLFNDRKS